jgi:hypothetical protein
MDSGARIGYAWESAILAPESAGNLGFAVRPEFVAERPRWMHFRKS